MYDLIGDIHGHAKELTALLAMLGYRKTGASYAHPERQAVFVGDFIDRGPHIREVLALVRPMVEEGRALAVMGNHELNALAYHTEDPTRPGVFLRPHDDKNVHQHRRTMEQLPPAELGVYLDWFRTLPLWLELDGIRVVHACWDEAAMRTIRRVLDARPGITPEFLQAACREGGTLFAPVEVLLKGKEAALPDGMSIQDKDGTRRTRMRTRWYLSPAGQTYRTYSLQSEVVACDRPLEAAVAAAAAPYPASAPPVFVGHYWLSAPRPELLADNVACLDYSVAKGGFLCAYRWHGEPRLRNEHFAWRPAGS
jgi:hypothetical protein